nr:dihydrodipicolinate synthase family protein [uncultured Kiloniella sp.]
MGQTGFIYLVDQNGMSLTESPHEGGFSAYDVLPEREQIRAALAGEHQYFDPAIGVGGHDVISVADSVTIPNGERWGLVYEIDRSEAMAVVNKATTNALIELAVTSLLVVLASWLAVRGVVKRLERLAGHVEELADEKRFVAIKESSDDIRRTTEIINKFGDRFDVFTGVDNLGYEALSVGAIGWVAGLVVAFPKETVAIYRLMQAGRNQEALEIYRWFRPLLDLDVSTYLVQNIKLAEQIELGSNDRCRMPRMPLIGAQRERAEKIIRDAIACRPELPSLT